MCHFFVFFCFCYNKAVSNKKKVSINGFGTFESVHSEARKGRNPSNGEEITIPAKERIRFRASKTFKDIVNK